MRALLFCAAALVMTPPGAGAGAQQSKLDRLAQGDPRLAKLSGGLLQARQEERLGRAPAAVARERMPAAVRGDRIQVILACTTVEGDLPAEIRRRGMTVVGIHPKYNWIVVQCDSAGELDALARRDDVRLIFPEPEWEISAGVVTSQADQSMGAAAARQTFGSDGSGVKVGILSDSFHRVIGGTLTGTQLTTSSSQLSGDLPPVVTIVDPGPINGIERDEGAAMGELIYDLAPGVEISFASAVGGVASFAANIGLLADDGAQVIVDDVLFTREPVYQDGFIAAAVDDAVARGVAYFTSAGNNGADAHEAPFTDIDPGSDDAASPPSGNDLHDFGGGDTHFTVDIPVGQAIIAVLHWNEPYGGGLGAGPGSSADLDIYVVNDTSLPLGANIVASSVTIQGNIASPLGDANELLIFQNTDSSPSPNTTFHVVIDRAGDGPDFRTPTALLLRMRRSTTVTYVDESFLGSRTIYGHTAAAGAIAVAAIDYREIDDPASFGPAGETNVEDFTSLGGDLPFYFDAMGAPLPGAPQTRFKPQLAAADRTNTSFFGTEDTEGDGFPNFSGTSAAAPHAAAVAALLLSREPGLTPAEIRARMQAAAIDAEGPGRDALSGDGWIEAASAVARTIDVHAPADLALSAVEPVTRNAPIHVDNAQGIADYAFDIELADGVAQVIDVVNGAMTAGWPDPGWSLTGAMGTTITLTVTNANGTSLTQQSGALFEIVLSGAVGALDGAASELILSASSVNGLAVTPTDGRVTIDNLAPGTGLDSSEPETTPVDPIPFSVSFSEPVEGFDAGDIVTTNATVVDFTAIDAMSYTFGLAPAGQGEVQAQIPAAAAADPAGNPAGAAAIARTFGMTLSQLTGAVLAFRGQGAPPPWADLDEDGSVDFAELTAALIFFRNL